MEHLRFGGPRKIVITLVLCLTATSALAGIADSPLPVLVAGKKTFHVYSVPGVFADPIFGTYFYCTSTDTAPMQVEVEVFTGGGGAPYNDGVATSLSVAPGATASFGTEIAAAISFSPDLGAAGLGRGSARILATSKKLVCTAFVADTGNAPPTTSWQLTIIKKTTQKGE
jgi:hypothetical protein